jgi:hypothetical protein
LEWSKTENDQARVALTMHVDISPVGQPLIALKEDKGR